MSRIKPLVLRFKDIESLRASEKDYADIGRETDVNEKEKTLTVRVYPRRSKKQQKLDARLQRTRREKNSYEYAEDEAQYEDKYDTQR